jgi:peptidoglycan/LPS O-acetylase OafA/YrhL
MSSATTSNAAPDATAAPTDATANAPAASPAAVTPAPRSVLRRFLELDLLDNRYPALHGLRVLAIVSVVQFHVTTIFALEQGVALDPEFAGSSLTVFFGMDLFFMLSGFLIGSILLRSLELSGSQRIWRFYVRRICRTFPSYYVVLTVLALATTLTVWQRQNLIYEYLYLTNFRILHRPFIVMFWGWSLALEEQFYLTVPALFFVLHRLRSDRARIVLLVALWSAALATRLYLYFRYAPWNDIALYSTLYFRTRTRFDTLVAGILLAFVHYRWRDAITRWLAAPFHRALVALPSLACLWLLLKPEMFGWEHVQLVHVFAWGSVTTVMYFGWLLLLLHSDGWIQRALSAPFFRRVATLGYGVYLVHIPLCDHALVPLARAAQARHVSMVIVWPASVAALMLGSLAIAYVMHVLIEKPSLRLRERLAG